MQSEMRIQEARGTCKCQGEARWASGAGGFQFRALGNLLDKSSFGAPSSELLQIHEIGAFFGAA